MFHVKHTHPEEPVMAWTTSATPTTKHTCGGPVFGRKTAGCPRCDEMLAGAPAVQWAPSARDRDRRDCADLAAHFASEKHRSGGCGYCTYGTW
jgi:hypothetical protein